MPNNREKIGDTNPFQSPELIDPHQIAEESEGGELTFAERIEKNRKARKRWSLGCWALGTLLIGLSMTSPPLAFYLVRIQKPLASSITIGTGIVALCTGIVCIVLGPISWFWFHRRSLK